MSQPGDVFVQLVLRDCIVKHQPVGFRCLSMFVLEISFLGSTNCQNVICANGGVCNPTPTTENGVEIQCLCLNGIRNLNSN
jgi:hypothetical protein